MVRSPPFAGMRETMGHFHQDARHPVLDMRLAMMMGASDHSVATELLVPTSFAPTPAV